MIDKLAWIEIKNTSILSTSSKGKTVWYIPGGKEQGRTDHEALIRKIDKESTINLVENSLVFFGEFWAQRHGHPKGTQIKMRCYTGLYFLEIKAALEICCSPGLYNRTGVLFYCAKCSKARVFM